MENKNSFFNIIMYYLAIIFWLFFTGRVNIGVIFVVLFLITIFAIIFKQHVDNSATNSENRQRRMVALKTARLFLAPYQDIWKDLKLVNVYCSLILGRDGKKIIAKERKSVYGEKCQYRSFTIIKSDVHSYEDLWNMFCLNFDNRTSYEELVELSKRFGVEIYEISQAVVSYDMNRYAKTEQEVKNYVEVKEKIDINNASEIELTSLPGISIVLAKKIIKKRESIGGFKTIDDLFLFLNLKPHMEKQLREIICANKMKGSIYLDRNSERRVDL